MGAAVHYMYMREYWVAVHASPVVYRYIDWTITVPLQMIEFNLIIKAAGASIGPGGLMIKLNSIIWRGTVMVHASPVVYRYIDWTITVPLQMIEFNLILKAAKAPISPAGFWRLLVGTVAMLAFGYAGESGKL